MIAIYGYKNGNYIQLDAPKTAVELSFQIASLRKPNAKVAPFSLTFDMPFSPTNNDFFGHQHDPSLLTTDFDLNRKTSARLYDSNVPIMQGAIQVTSIDVSGLAYKCRFFSETADFFDAVKGKSWDDVWRDSAGNVLCPLDHPLTDSNVTDSWLGAHPGGLLPAYTMIYALTDVGIPLVSGWDYPSYYYGYWDEAVKVQNFRPCVRVSWLLDEILAMAGYVRDTAQCFFSDALYNSSNLYMMCGLGGQSLPTRFSYGFYVQSLSTWPALACGGTGTYGFADPVQWDVPPSAPYYDTDGQLNIYTWTSEVSQNAAFEFTFYAENYTGGAGDPLPNFNVAVYDLAPNPNNLLGTWQFEYEDANAQGVTWAPTFAVPAGAQVIVYIQCTGASTATTVEVSATWSLVAYDVANGNNATTVKMTEALGRQTLDKFIQGLCDTYNLVINVDEDQKKVAWQRYDDWIESGGSAIDWTEKIDASGPMQILPASEYVPRQMFLKPAEGKDHRNMYYARTFGVRKGEMRYQSRNDFAIEDLIVGDAFTLLRSTKLKGLWMNNGLVNPNVPTTNIVISELWSSFDGDRVEYESQENALCYYHGQQSFPATPINIGGTQFDEAPLFTSYSGSGADSDIFSLEYALSAPDLVNNQIIGSAVNGLYDKFWYSYLQGLFSRDARVVKCQARLDALDIQQLDYSRYVNVRNVQYRIMSIENYVVGGDGLCNLTLFKRADGFLFDCGLTPTVQVDGRVTWVDGSGISAVPTELCCVSYGYTWNASTSTCSAHENRTIALETGDNGSDTIGGVVNRSSGQAISKTGNPTRKYLGGLVSPVTTEQWDMYAQTKSNVTEVADSILGQQVFKVTPDRIVTVTVSWLAVVTDGADKGKSASGEEEYLLTTQSSVTAKSSGSIFSRGLGGYTIDLVVTDLKGGSEFQIECTGANNNDADWYIEVSTVMYDTNRLTSIAPYEFAEFQDGDSILFQNNDLMEWNDQ